MSRLRLRYDEPAEPDVFPFPGDLARARARAFAHARGDCDDAIRRVESALDEAQYHIDVLRSMFDPDDDRPPAA